MNTTQFQHYSLPLIIGLRSNGQVGLVPTNQFKTIIDDSGGFTSMFDIEGFTINSIDYEYQVWYNCDSDLETWLKAQNISLGGFI